MELFHQILVYAAILFILVSLYREWFRPALTFIITIGFLGIFQVISPAEILEGVANEQIYVILLLLLLGDIYRRTSILDIAFHNMFKYIKGYKGFVGMIFLIIAPLSAFLNNTPLVALMMPYVHKWSNKVKISESKLLIPLSYAAILGGCMTLIGTSTHLIVSGLVLNQNIVPDLDPLNMFDFLYVGLPMLIIGFLYVLFAGAKLLPVHKNPIDSFQSHAREYVIETVIKEGSELHGKTIAEAKLRNLEGLYLFSIYRDKVYLSADPTRTVLREKDQLTFAGKTEAISKLLKKNPSIEIPSVGMFAKKQRIEVIEIVISHNSALINKSLEEENFRANYDATVLAVHRNGERVQDKMGTISLKAGDTLLLLAGDSFKTLVRQTNNFYLISKPQEIKHMGVVKTSVLIGGTLLVILLAALKVTSLFMGLLVFIPILLLMGVTNGKQLARSLDLQLGLLITMALALGKAMVNTGVAEQFAQAIIHTFMPFGSIGLLIAIFIVTSILASFITNVAAVALIFPISLTLAHELSLPYLPFILVVSFAAAANFMTPIGYQTNTMVFGPGAYKFKDFLKVGTPLTILYLIVTVLVLYFCFF